MIPRTCLTIAAACAALWTARDPGLTPARAALIRDSVASTLDGFRAQSAAGRWDSVLTYYADVPEFRWVEEGRVVAESVAVIRHELLGLPPGVRLETIFTGTAIAPLGPGAASVTTGFTTRMFDASGEKFSFSGVMTIAMVHRGPRWQFLTGHSSAARQERAP